MIPTSKRSLNVENVQFRLAQIIRKRSCLLIVARCRQPPCRILALPVCRYRFQPRLITPCETIHFGYLLMTQIAINQTCNCGGKSLEERLF